MRILNTAVLFLFLVVPYQHVYGQVHLSEGFESGSRPQEWTEETVSGDEPWRYRNGGHSPNDNNWLVPPDEEDITRNPPSAYEGTYNAIFFKQGDNNERTKLITPELDLLGATSLELSFYLCQIPWTFEGANGWDILRIYYKTTAEGEWVLLHEYLDPIFAWEQQTLVLPNPSSTYYVAFEGQTRWGYGTCIDNILIQETEAQNLYLGDIEFHQPFDEFIPSGSSNVPLMRMDLKVFGNTGSAILQSLQVNSLNTSDDDIVASGVKLFHTTTQEFDTEQPLGTPTDFLSGSASFSNINYNLPPGLSYLWVACDIELLAAHGHILDAMIPAGGIQVNDTLYPDASSSPAGAIMIYETLYHQDFEGGHGWELTGEFEVAEPDGMGGSPGNPNPQGAASGTRVLGTDVTGLGENPYHYEPNLTNATGYTAASPNMDVFYYKSLNIFFKRYLNIEVWDHSSIEVSNDDGATWNPIWTSNSYLSDFQWMNEKIAIPDEYARSEQFKIRYKLGPTDGFSNYSGWNIDDVFITGEYISKDVGVSEWIYPQSGSGHTSNDSVTVRIRNYGGEPIVDPVLVAYSFNGGDTWKIDQMNQNIPVGGSVVFTFPSRVDLSEPGLRPSVIAKTAMPGDQYAANDQLVTELYMVPTYVPPYMQQFEEGDGYWRSFGTKLWEYGTPAGSVINSAFSGDNSWVTGLNRTYGTIISDENEIIFTDDFETEQGWTFTGEFERATPSNMYLPYFAFGGYYCLGTDLSGLGAHPYFYENGITAGTAQTATTPAIDVSRYSDLYLNFASWIVIQDGDSIKLEASDDNGAHWIELWKNTEGGITEEYYQIREIELDNSLSYTDQLRFRFSLFQTSASGPVAEGWIIDNFELRGDLVELTPGYLSSPSFDLTGLERPVVEARLWVDSEEGIDGVTLFYSLDDGENWDPVTNSSGYDTYWNWYTGNPVVALGQNGWSGVTGGWINVRHLLPPELLNKENVQFKFEFGADKVNNQHDGVAIDDVRILEAPNDVDLLQILDPVSACELSGNQEFVLRMRNAGMTAIPAGDSIRIGYNIERDGDIQTGEETVILESQLAVGSSRNFNMSMQFDFSQRGDYFTEVFLVTEDPHFYKIPSGDTIEQIIMVNKPQVDLGENISTVRPDTVVLRAYSGVTGQTYLWQDGSTDSLFHVSTDGIYHVTVTNGIGCQARDTVEVMQLIADVGIGSLDAPQSDCELGNQLPIEITIENFGTDTVNIGESIIVMGAINQGTPFGDTVVLGQRFTPGQTIDFVFPDLFDFSLPGNYQVEVYTSMSNDMDTDNDTLTQLIEVYGYPDSYLGPDTVVLAAEYLLTPAPGYLEYSWQDGSTSETFLVTEPGVGLYHVNVTDEHQCSSSDSVFVTLNVLDLALEALLSPSTSCELSETITVSARFRNVGNQAIPSGENVQLGYRIDGGPVVLDQVILDQNLLPGNAINFTFSQSETVQTGEWYDFTVFVDYLNDSKPFNDTITQSVGVFETPTLDLGDDFQVVTELEYTLDAGPGFATYEWQDGSTEQTYTITRTGVGRYWVNVMDVNGCSVSDSVDVMLAVPDVGLLEISHPVTTCHLESEEYVTVAVQNFGNWDILPGAGVNVAYSIDGAEAVVEPLVLEETFEPGSVVYHTFSRVEDFSEPGRYEIVAYTQYASDLVPTNDIILVNMDHFGSPLVDIGMGQDTIVVYEPMTLSATQGYSSYLWQDGSTGNEYPITQPSQGMYIVVVTGDNGCETHDSVYVAYDVPDLELIRIEAPRSSCAVEGMSVVSLEIANNGYFRISTEDTLTITYSVDGGSSVIENISLESELLQGGATVVSFVSGYDFSSLGSYQIQASLLWTMDGNLSNNLVSSTVHVWGYPVVEIEGVGDTLYTTLPVTLDAGLGHTAYMWQDLSTGSSYEVTEPGLYWVMALNEYGCADTDSVQVFNGTAVGEIGMLPGEVRIYPNPVSEVIHIALEMEPQKEVRIELYSVNNSLIYRRDIQSPAVKETHIDVQDLLPGTYLLRITTDEVPHTFKVIVD